MTDAGAKIPRLRQTSENIIVWPDISFGPVNLWSMPKMSSSYEKLIYENLEKGYQYKLVVSEFKGVEYISLRKYYQTYEGEFVPSKEGATIPVTIQNVFALLDALVELTATEESVEVITKYFSDKISSLNKVQE